MGYNLTRIFVIRVDLCVIRIMKSRRRWWVGHIGRVRYAYRILLGKFLEKRQFEHHEPHGKITLILILGGNILWESVMDWTDSGWCPKAGFGIRGECCLLDGQFNAHEQLRSLIRTVHIFITNLSFIFYDNWTFIICNLYDLSICVQKGIKLGVSNTIFNSYRLQKCQRMVEKGGVPNVWSTQGHGCCMSTWRWNWETSGCPDHIWQHIHVEVTMSCLQASLARSTSLVSDFP